MRRVAIVDDDEVSRRGMAAILEDHPEIVVAGAVDHQTALDWNEEWDDVDVAMVDAADEHQDDDHFPGVGVVEHIRQRRTPVETLVVVITGHFFDDAVRVRMREARADFFYHRSQTSDSATLYQVVLRPDEARRGVLPPSDPEELFSLGVRSDTRVNEGIAFARDSGLATALGLDSPFKRLAPRSRVWRRRRKDFQERARLAPVNADGTPPERHQAEASLPQIERFLRWATRSKPSGKG